MLTKQQYEKFTSELRARDAVPVGLVPPALPETVAVNVTASPKLLGFGYSMLGARFATSWVLPSGPAVTPRISAAWQHAFGDVTPAAALTFQTLGTSFNIAGVPLARDAAVVDAGFDVRVTPQLTLALSYFGKLAGNAEDHSVKGTFAYRF